MDYAKILIVDDEPANVRLLERILSKAQYCRVRSTTDSSQAVPLLKEFDPDIILLDLQMPEPDGFTLLAEFKKVVPAGCFLPVLVLTADATPQTKLRALSNGAHDFLTKPFDNAEVVQRVGNLVQTRRLHLQIDAQRENLEETVRERTSELEKALQELRTTQEQVVQQERLHAFGTMASGVAHDFNNALSVILGFGEIALQRIEQGTTEDLNKCLSNIVVAARDGARLVTRLREFYRPNSDNEPRAAVDLNALIRQIVAITEPKWKSESLGRDLHVDVVIKTEEISPIAGDPSELREALTNLIFNAVDAMPEGGTITLRTRAQEGRVTLEIADTGTGMTEEVRRHCLEPFYSTKGELGTGMGLAMVYGIVQRHGGTLDIQSAVGRGTTFIISLPIHDAYEPKKESAPSAVSRPLNILVADDQPVLCELVDEYLRRDFHTVSTARDGQEAFDRFQKGNFDLVITDQAMPSMTGSQLAAAIKDVSPRTPIILLTGFGESPQEDAARNSIDEVLSKPVSSIDLRQALVRVFAH